MVLKKLHFPIFIIVLFLFFCLQSCEKKPQNSLKKKNNLVKIDRLIDLGDLCFNNLDYDNAYYYHSKAKSLCNPKTDQTRIIYSLYQMSFIQRIREDYSGSETTAVEALPFLKNMRDPSYKCSIYSLLGDNYDNVFNYDTALYYYKQALALNVDKFRKTIIKNSIAVVYMDQLKYRQAVNILLPLTLQKELSGDTDIYPKILDNLGFSYYNLGDAKGIDYMKQSLKIKEKIKDHRGLIASYYHLALYYKESNPNLAHNYARLAYEKATKTNSVKSRLKILELLIENSSGTVSKAYSMQYLHINDSITKVRQKARNQFAKMKYDSKKEKEENLSLKAQKIENALRLEREKNRNLLLTFIVGISIAIGAFLVHYLTAKNKREKIQTSYDTETRISKKLHDELANDVYQTMAFAETQDLSSDENREVLVNNLDTIYSRTRNISKENSVIETGIHFVPNLKEMLSGFNTNEVNVLVNGLDSIRWSEMEINKKITIYRVLQELLVNMKKHSQCSLVAITFKKNENKLHIDYSDNGVGAAIEEINLKNGLLNVENRIQAIKGSLTFDSKSNKGFKVSIIIPL